MNGPDHLESNPDTGGGKRNPPPTYKRVIAKTALKHAATQGQPKNTRFRGPADWQPTRGLNPDRLRPDSLPFRIHGEGSSSHR